MPCYEVNTFSAELRMQDRDLMEEALQKLGLKYTRHGNRLTVSTAQGTIVIGEKEATLTDNRGSQQFLVDQMNAINREYSRIIIQKAAVKGKWTTRWNAQKTKAIVTRG